MTSKEKASASVKRVDYMTVYSSDLVKAVRKAAGGIGILFPLLEVHHRTQYKCSVIKIP